MKKIYCSGFLLMLNLFPQSQQLKPTHRVKYISSKTKLPIRPLSGIIGSRGLQGSLGSLGILDKECRDIATYCIQLKTYQEKAEYLLKIRKQAKETESEDEFAKLLIISCTSILLERLLLEGDIKL